MKSSSLFWQLYRKVLLATLISLLVFVGLKVYIDTSTQYEDFIRDIEYFAKPLLSKDIKTKQEWQKIADYNIRFHDFNYKIFSHDEAQTYFENSEYQKEIDGIKIYLTSFMREEDDEDYFLQALYPIGSIASYENKYLVISDSILNERLIQYSNEDLLDRNQFLRIEEDMEDREIERDLLVIISTFVVFMLLLMIFLYFIVKNVTNHIYQLISVSETYASGNLKARADGNAPSPINLLALGFNSMADQLEEKLTEQQVMSNAISHELRTPLSKIRMANSLLEKRITGEGELGLIRNIDSCVDELELLTNEILTLAKLNFSESDIRNENVDVIALCKDCISEFSNWITERKFYFDSDQLTSRITGNSFYLKMVIDNLLKNAVKYGKNKIKISVKTSTQQLVLNVEDDGRGIPHELQKSVFIPFSRIDQSRNRNTGGFGLGLAIVESIVKKHGGSIEITKSVLGGAKFTIYLAL